MRVLHLCNDYCGSVVHEKLFESLEKQDVDQIVYVALNYRNRNRVNLQQFNDSAVRFSIVLKRRHRLLYNSKIKLILEDLINRNIDFSSISLIHASTWCLDGAIAYELKKKYDIPYIITVRNTDINMYYKYFLFKRKYFYDIMMNSSSIIFISESYRLSFFNLRLPNSLKKYNKSNIYVINNGIDDIFLDNPKLIKNKTPTKFLYIGNFTKNKNIYNVYKAVKYLRKKQYNLSFTSIGFEKKKKNSYQNRIINLEKKNDWFKVLEKKSQDFLINLISEYDIFIMTSFHETFGLVYVESLTQGLPIIYTKGQGFDNTFPEGFVGYSTPPDNHKLIAKSIEKLLSNYDEILKNIENLSFENFRWDNIAAKYLKIYGKILLKVLDD